MFMLNGKLLGEAFPINKVEVFFDAEDHSDFLGFQWERVSQGKIQIGLDDSDTDFNTIGKTGGEKEVTLTADEVPAHNHTFWKGDNVSGSGNRVMTGYGGTVQGDVDIYSSSAGGGQPHNNMPPYIVMAFWKRIA